MMQRTEAKLAMTNNLSKKSPPSSICLLRLSAIGDCCHALALVQYIQTQWPQSQITWVIGKIEAQLMSALLPNVDFIIFDKKQGRTAFKNLRAQMRNKKFDVLLHLQANMRANLVSLCIPAKVRIGFGKERARELQWIFTNQKAPIGKGIHVAEGMMDFAEALGLPAAIPRWQSDIPKEALDWAKQHTDGRPLMVLCPAASKAERNWTTVGYAKILEHAKQCGMKTILVGSPAPSESRLAQDIANLTTAIDENLVGKTSLVQLLAILSLAKIVVSPDTGPAHMATIVGTPVLGLYAAQTPKRTGPYLCQDQAISVYDECLLEETGKTMAEVPWRTRVKNPQAMQRIGSQDVIKAFDLILSSNTSND